MAQNPELKALHESIAWVQANPKMSRRRYPQELKQRVVQHCQQERLKGRSYQEIAIELEITSDTLKLWLAEQGTPKPSLSSRSSRPARERREVKRPPRPRALRPVKVVEPVQPTTVDKAPPPHFPQTLTVTTPRGFRIEGLSWPQVLELAELGS